MLDWLFLVFAGRVFVNLVRKFPIAKTITWAFFRELFDCPICLGFWVYFSLYAFFGTPEVFEYVPFVSEALFAAVTSFGVQVFVVGWSVMYGSILEE